MEHSTGTLFLVPTPIGNLGDITIRAVDVLRSVDRIVAEDTRHSRKLLSHLALNSSRLSRLDAHASGAELSRVIGWLQEGQDVALITDAGTPAVSDPGTPLVRDAIHAGIAVTALPGPSAVTTAAAISGLVDCAFVFLGFLPRSGHDRAEAIHRVALTSEPCVLFESPHRIASLLDDLGTVMPTRQAAVARELSKLHEEVVRGTLSALAETEREWVGEITLVLGTWQVQRNDVPSDEQLDRRIEAELSQGGHTRTVAERVAAWSGRSRREMYERVLIKKRGM